MLSRSPGLVFHTVAAVTLPASARRQAGTGHVAPARVTPAQVMLVASGRRPDQAEGVPRGVEEDPEGLARLHLVLAGTQRDDRGLSGVEVVDLEVEVQLLGMLGAGAGDLHATG